MRQLLECFGGVWITPDVTLRRYLEIQDETTTPEFNRDLSEATGANIYGHSFDNEPQAIRFFEEVGFSVQRHSLIEVSDVLVSPVKLQLSPHQVERMLGSAVLFVMSAQK
jgi:hypothetical protein